MESAVKVSLIRTLSIGNDCRLGVLIFHQNYYLLDQNYEPTNTNNTVGCKMTMSVPGKDYQVDNHCLSQDGSPKHYAGRGPRQSQCPVVLHLVILILLILTIILILRPLLDISGLTSGHYIAVKWYNWRLDMIVSGLS